MITFDEFEKLITEACDWAVENDIPIFTRKPILRKTGCCPIAMIGVKNPEKFGLKETKDGEFSDSNGLLACALNISDELKLDREDCSNFTSHFDEGSRNYEGIVSNPYALLGLKIRNLYYEAL